MVDDILFIFGYFSNFNSVNMQVKFIFYSTVIQYSEN